MCIFLSLFAHLRQMLWCNKKAIKNYKGNKNVTFEVSKHFTYPLFVVPFCPKTFQSTEILMHTARAFQILFWIKITNLLCCWFVRATNWSQRVWWPNANASSTYRFRHNIHHTHSQKNQLINENGPYFSIKNIDLKQVNTKEWTKTNIKCL